jgi:hypothetical protein
MEVKVTPGGAYGLINEQVQFTANQSGVTWRASRGTITQGGLYTAPATYGIAEIVASLAEAAEWTALRNVTPSGASHTKTGGNNGAWDAGARSVQDIPFGNGEIDWLLTADTAVGLSHRDYAADFDSIDFCLRTAGGTLEVRERGALRHSTSWSAGDRGRIVVRDRNVDYFKGNTYLYTAISAPLSYPLAVDTSIFYSSGQVQDVKIATDAQAGRALAYTIPVLSYVPDYSFELTIDKKVRSSEAEDRSMVWRVKSEPWLAYPLVFADRDYEEMHAHRALWEECYGQIPIFFQDGPTGLSGAFFFDSPIKVKPVSHDSFDISYVLRGV